MAQQGKQTRVGVFDWVYPIVFLAVSSLQKTSPSRDAFTRRIYERVSLATGIFDARENTNGGVQSR